MYILSRFHFDQRLEGSARAVRFHSIFEGVQLDRAAGGVGIRRQIARKRLARDALDGLFERKARLFLFLALFLQLALVVFFSVWTFASLQNEVQQFRVVFTQTPNKVEQLRELAERRILLANVGVALFQRPQSGVLVARDAGGDGDGGGMPLFAETHAAPNLLDGDPVGHCGIAEEHVVAALGVYAFADGLAGMNHVDLVVGRFVQLAQKPRPIGHRRGCIHPARRHLAVREEALKGGAALVKVLDGVLGLSVDLRVERKDAAVAGVLDRAGKRLDHRIARQVGVHGRQDAKVARPGTRLGSERVRVRELEHGLPEVLGGRCGKVGHFRQDL